MRASLERRQLPIFTAKLTTTSALKRHRSVALSLVGQLSLRLDEESSHLTTQLNIICKNLASALRAFSSDPAAGHAPAFAADPADDHGGYDSAAASALRVRLSAAPLCCCAPLPQHS
jgi:hypothetical protein